MVFIMSELYSTTKFHSIREFQSYFQESDELVIPNNQLFQVRNIYILTGQDEEKEIMPADRFQDLIYVLNKMLVPIAKAVQLSIEAPLFRDISYEIEDNLSLRANFNISIKTFKNTINTNLTDLFKLMIASSIMEVEFEADQKLMILGIPEEEVNRGETLQERINNVVQPRIPFGFKCEMSRGHYSLGSGRVSIGSRQRSCCVVSASQGMKFSLSEYPIFSFSINSFRKLISEIVFGLDAFLP